MFIRLNEALKSSFETLDRADPSFRRLPLIYWDQVVGPVLARKVRPCFIKGSLLFLRADNPTWAQEISYQAGTILERLNALLEDQPISAFRFLASRQLTAPSPDADEEHIDLESIQLSTDEEDRITSMVREITEPQQRERVAAILRQAARRKIWEAARGRIVCRACAGPLSTDSALPAPAADTLCPWCRERQEGEQREGLRTILRQTPWLDDGEIAAMTGLPVAEVARERKLFRIALEELIRTELINRPDRGEMPDNRREIMEAYVMLTLGRHREDITTADYRLALGSDLASWLND